MGKNGGGGPWVALRAQTAYPSWCAAGTPGWAIRLPPLSSWERGPRVKTLPELGEAEEGLRGDTEAKAVTCAPSSSRGCSTGFSHHPQAWSNPDGLAGHRGEAVRSFFSPTALGLFPWLRARGFQSSKQVPGKQGGCWQASPPTTVPGTHVPEHSATCTRVYTHTVRLQNRVGRCVRAQPCRAGGSTPGPQRAHLPTANAPVHTARLRMRARPPGAQARVGACVSLSARERPSSGTASPPGHHVAGQSPGLGSPAAPLPQRPARSVRGEEERGFRTSLILWLLALC